MRALLTTVHSHWQAHSRLFKLAISALLMWLVYEQMMAAAWSLRSLQLSAEGWALFLLAILLLIGNLGTEACKYQVALRAVGVRHSLAQCMLAVLAGATAGLLTPNRLGEYPARLAYVERGERAAALTALLADRVAQMGITLVAGIVALGMLPDFPLRYVLMAGVGLALVGLLLWSWQPDAVTRLLSRWSWLARQVRAHVGELPALPRRILPRLVLLAALRYGFFAAQYLLLLYAFGLQHALALSAALVCVVYLLKSVVPGIALAELGIREAIAIGVFGWAGIADSVAVFNATLALFAINLLLPAVVGLLPTTRVLWKRL